MEKSKPRRKSVSDKQVARTRKAGRRAKKMENIAQREESTQSTKANRIQIQTSKSKQTPQNCHSKSQE
jgi:hypothetical protein